MKKRPKIMSMVKKELVRDKKRILKVSWVNRNNETKQAYVRIAGFAYDSDGHPIVVVRSAEHKNMLFNLRISRVYEMTPVSSSTLNTV